MRKGVTLIELLVTIGIIAVLIGASLASFSKMSKTADRTRAQELVSQAMTAMTAIYEADGMWPKSIRDASANDESGRLDDKIALILAKRGYMSLSMDKSSSKLVGRDRFGVLTPWAAKVVERKGSGAGESDPVGGGTTVKDNVLYFAVDLNGDGEITADEGASRVGLEVIRATVAVWSIGRSGGNNGKPWPYETGLKKDDVYSWTRGQTRKAQ